MAVLQRISADATIVHNDDGTHDLTLQPGQNYFDRDTGLYEASDSTIRSDETVPGFTHNVKAGSARARFADGGKIRFGLKHPLYVTYAPRGAAAVEAGIAGNRATFAGLWPGVDMDLVKFPDRIKETLTLADSSAPSTYTWDLEEIAGVVPTLATDGGLDYVETLSGQVIGRIPAPVVRDSAGAEGPATLSYAGGEITVAIDPAWLADPLRVWPVALDPTTTLQEAGTGPDNTLYSVNPTTIYASDPRVLIGWNEYRYILRFLTMPTVSSLGGKGFISASLQVAQAADPEPSHVGGATANVVPISRDWDATATWNSAKTGTSWTSAGGDVTGADGVVWSVPGPVGVPTWRSLDVSAIVRKWYFSQAANYGWRFASADLITDSSYRVPVCTNNYADPTYAPKLVLTLTDAPTASVTSPAGTELAPATYTDQVSGMAVTGSYSSSGGIAQAKYRFRVLDDADNVVLAQAWQAGNANTWTIPDGLAYGNKYQMVMDVEDANGGTGTSAAVWITCVMSAPAGLGSTPNPGSARIDLAWDPHAGENLAGYRVYRREFGATAWDLFSIGVVPTTTVDTYYFLNVQQISLIVETHYHDRIPETDVTYEYEVTAVATDGYESPASSLTSASVTVTGFWAEDTQVHLAEAPVFEYPRRSSAQAGTNGAWLIQDLGLQGRRLQLLLAFHSRAERGALLALFPAGQQFSYRDQEGNTFRGAVVGPIAETRIQRTPEFYGSLRLEAAEVAAS